MDSDASSNERTSVSMIPSLVSVGLVTETEMYSPFSAPLWNLKLPPGDPPSTLNPLPL